MSFCNFKEVREKEVQASTTPKNNCDVCKLYETCASPKLRLFGDGNKKVLIVGSYPYKEEDRVGVYGRDKEMYFLIDQLESLGINFEKDCWYTTAVNCRPVKGDPTTKNVNLCRSRLLSFIDKLQPKSIILMGEFAFDSLIGPRLTGRITGTSFSAFVGETIPDAELGKWICPVWPVSFLFSRKEYSDGNYSKSLYERDGSILPAWKNQLNKAFSIVDTPIESVDYESLCKTTQDVDQAIDWLIDAMEWPEVSFDYETNSIKCFRHGAKIVAVSISNGEVSMAFPFFQDAQFLKVWKKFMLSNNKKISHNMAFEGLWTREIGGYWFTNWYWDTMLAAHCIHNTKPTGLKFCTYTKFGIIGYDAGVDTFIKSSTEERDKYGDNAFNTIDNAPLDELLLYNAMDSLFTFRLYQIQKEQLQGDYLKGFQFFMESALALTKTQHNGFVLNMEQYQNVTTDLNQKIHDAEVAIMESDAVKQWDKEGAFNFNSGPQLSHLLYDIMKIKPTSMTKGGKPSVDAESLEKMDNPLVQLILTQRKYQKLLGTYIHQYKVEETDGKIHPSFYLNRVDTFRSSSSSVNVQNLPKRDPDAKKMITSLVLPQKGHKLVSYDFKSLEILIGACHSGDENLIEFASDPTKDMHRATAADIFMLDEVDVSKSLRSSIKSAAVFAEFYGSYWKQTAPDCWEVAKQEGLIEHLKKKGVKTFAQFEDRVRIAEEIMWNERFPQHNLWRQECWKLYQKQGYLDSLTGFKIRGPIKRNNSFNSAVQGDGYHVLQWGYNKVLEEIERLELDVLPWAEIHDAGDYSVNPKDEKTLDSLVWKYYTQEVKKHWPWIIVNLQVEKEAGKVDADWSTLETIGFLDENGEIKG
jgi:uracil-DNA glycosylase family 4